MLLVNFFFIISLCVFLARNFREKHYDWEGKREAQIAHDLLLQESTCDWLASLPANIRPTNLAKQFPCVANKIASVWARPLACDKVMEELMLDHRGKRTGFPVEVGAEIAILMDYYNKEVYVLKHDVWSLA